MENKSRDHSVWDAVKPLGRNQGGGAQEKERRGTIDVTPAMTLEEIERGKALTIDPDDADL